MINNHQATQNNPDNSSFIEKPENKLSFDINAHKISAQNDFINSDLQAELIKFCDSLPRDSFGDELKELVYSSDPVLLQIIGTLSATSEHGQGRPASLKINLDKIPVNNTNIANLADEATTEDETTVSTLDKNLKATFDSIRTSKTDTEGFHNNDIDLNKELNIINSKIKVLTDYMSYSKAHNKMLKDRICMVNTRLRSLNEDLDTEETTLISLVDQTRKLKEKLLNTEAKLDYEEDDSISLRFENIILDSINKNLNDKLKGLRNGSDGMEAEKEKEILKYLKEKDIERDEK
jgi:hypothetical protein